MLEPATRDVPAPETKVHACGQTENPETEDNNTLIGGQTDEAHGSGSDDNPSKIELGRRQAQVLRDSAHPFPPSSIRRPSPAIDSGTNEARVPVDDETVSCITDYGSHNTRELTHKDDPSFLVPRSSSDSEGEPMELIEDSELQGGSVIR